MVRILHTADWQLGAPFAAFPERVRTLLAEARLDVIDRIGAVARENDVRHVLVAGDVFDSPDPGDRVTTQALARMKAAGCEWWLMPGNHDHVRGGALWPRLRRAGSACVHVLDRPEAEEMEAGVWVLPAPLVNRHTAEDLTAAFDRVVTPPGAVRIGLAHGPVKDFSSGGQGQPNLIPPDRAERSGLDYLALGDWHGFVRIGQRTAYSGTPEPDRFGQEKAGHVVLADVGAGRLPEISGISVGRYVWAEREWRPESAEDVRREKEAVLSGGRASSTLLSLHLKGALALAALAEMNRELADLEDHLLYLRQRDEIVRRPDGGDLSCIGPEGALALAAARLKALAEGGDMRAGRALERLYTEVLRVSGSGS
ncbi:DNA repair exonuclease [Acetobacter sp. AN02]|uniref:metallophosphoesterase family protein n=1 Tax=Acetobacter sp. AN02 TaxID=2894186 RepID=UPI0024346004|nr:DNA repair exonuclease [Acetobacter sp. AN02]